MNTENVSTDFLPKYEAARIAVERARQIVKENNEMISKMKSDADITDQVADYDPFLEAESFSHQDSYAFDLYKIKSTNGIKDFIKDIFGVH
ncbi:MAG: DNA-directed RNA polymerase subunit omega [Bacteriovorax sp.]|nr:DNA-directed RNA polymerase subunit omega [Bacteriovorax sp.]